MPRAWPVAETRILSASSKSHEEHPQDTPRRWNDCFLGHLAENLCHSEATYVLYIIECVIINKGRGRKEWKRTQTQVRQPASGPSQIKVQWNKQPHVLSFTKKKAIFNLKFSRKVVSSYKKEANKLKMKPHWTWWLNASSNGKVRVRTITYLVCLRGREFTYSTVVQYSSSLSDAITVTNELLSTRAGVLSKQLLKRIQSSGSI